MIGRREFITLLGVAAAAPFLWPLAARAQQQSMPVIGWLGTGWRDTSSNLAAFHKGLNEAGFVEGRNVAIEYRWEEGQYDRLPALAADLVRRSVAVIFASGGPRPTRAAKAATSTIPIVFNAATDPVATGLVASLNRPGGNVTGAYALTNELGTKQLGLLREIVPAATMIALLVNANTPGAAVLSKDVQSAVRSVGLQLQVLSASTEADLDKALAGLAQQRPDALLIQSDVFLNRHTEIAAMAARLGIATISALASFAAAGGLMSYGSGSADSHQAGLYVGRILKGAKPADLPVVQSSRFELVINLKTAKALGLTVPPTLLAIADEVIE
jgi:putative ABC transport system substrate-binding protein